MQLLSTHPSQADLLEFAELFEENAGRASAAIYAHVVECERCAAEVERARATLALTRRAAELEPSREWRAQTLLAARQIRGRHARPSRRWLAVSNRRAMLATAALAIAACAGLTASLFAAAGPAGLDKPEGPSQAAVFSLDVLQQASLEERLLAPAVLSGPGPVTPWVAAQQRAVHAWDAEIDEALEALESNPACVRAAALVNTNRERLGETLKVLYVERDF